MKYIKVTHKKPECIGCALCAEVAPGFWRMNADGVAQLIQPIRRAPPFEYANGFPEDLRILHQAEKGCPVGIIRIT